MSYGTLAFDIDGVLIDTRPSYQRIVKELSGADDEDIAWFKANGGFNDDWELARALKVWLAAGRPPLINVQGVMDVVALAPEHDPGDLAPQADALYREYWTEEKPLVDSGLLHMLVAEFDVVAVTGRRTWEFERAQELLDFRFPRFTHADIVRKPDPEALLRLLDPGTPFCLVLGDTQDDRLLARQTRLYTRVPILYHHVEPGRSPQDLLELLHREPEHAQEHAQRHSEPG